MFLVFYIYKINSTKNNDIKIIGVLIYLVCQEIFIYQNLITLIYKSFVTEKIPINIGRF